MFLKINDSQLFYTKQGLGKKTLLLFHGFGQDHRAFQEIIYGVSSEYTCYSFDLYFHGSSSWNKDEQPLEKNEWKSTIETFLRENHLNDISLLGYSLGAKFVLATLEAFPEKVKEIFLVAPDGIKTSFWYSLATYPVLLRKIFKSMIDHQKRFIRLAGFAHTIGLIDKGIIRFIESQMNSEEKRRRVYYSWVVFRHLKFDMVEIAEMINRQQPWLMIIVGKYDKIIKTESMNVLLDHVDQYQLEILEAGHNHLLKSETGNLLISKSRNI